MIRVGLIGAGFIGRIHFDQYEKLRNRAKLVALCDKEPDRRSGDWSKVGGNLPGAPGTKRDLRGARSYDNWHDLIADANVEMIDICTPTFLHREMAVEALKAGKHVLCEKPMALTVEHCDEMIAASRSAPGKFMIAQCIRFWPEYVYLRQAVETKRYGALKAIHFRRQTSVPHYSLNEWLRCLHVSSRGA